LDPGNIGMVQGWPEHGLPLDAVPAEVPGVWNTTFPGFSGAAWCEAAFSPRLPPGGTVRLVIGAANYLTDAWLNGVYLGCHEGGYDAFSFRCTESLRQGANRLTLRIVDPPLDGEIDGLRLRTAPTAKESWYGGCGGLWDGLWLERSSSIWFEDVRVHGDLARECATFQVTLAGDIPTAEHVRMVAQVRDRRANGDPDPRAGIVGENSAPALVGTDGLVLALTVPVRTPRLWSPESPTTYAWQLRIERPGDEQPDLVIGTLGFRTCELRDGVPYLNGEPRYLKGALLQPTYPRSLLMPPPSLLDRDVELAKAAGLNLLRCHLRPPPPGFLDRCDRAGIMAYVEPPLAWIEPSGRLLEHGKRELASLVRMCGNHPSVVMWGIFNENARATEAVGADLLAELAALDPTRPIVENSGGAAVGEVGMWAWGGQSRCWSPGWESPRPLNDVHVYLANPLRREARTLLATLGDGPTLDVTPGRPPDERLESRLSGDAVLVSEYGCGALPDFEAALAAFGEEQHLADAALLRDLRDDLARSLATRGLDREIGDVPSLVRQTQTLQAEGILAQTAALRRNPNVSGLIVTQLADAGWEQMAGLAGLWRHPRPALDALARALRPRLFHVEPDDPCSTGSARIRAWLIEDPGLPPIRGDGELRLSVEHRDLTPRGGEVILPPAPGRYRLRARLTVGDWSDEAACTVRRLPSRAPASGEGLVVLGRGLRGALPAALPELPPDWSGPILAHLPSGPALKTLARAVERARAGAHLCLLGLEPRMAAHLAPLLGLPLTMHGARGNFMGMHHYLRQHPLFAGLDAPCLADGAFSEVLPAWAAEELPTAKILAGCLTVPDGGRGFLWRGSVQTLPFGDGRLTLYQLGAGSRDGGVLGRYLLDTLVAWLLAGR